MLSIGRRSGSIQPQQVRKNHSDTKKWSGVKHWKVDGLLSRSSLTNNSCSSVVPLRQCPMMNTGGPCSEDVANRRPQMQC